MRNSIARSYRQSKVYFKVALSRMFETKLGLIIWSFVGFASTFAMAYAWYVAGQGQPDIAGLEYKKILAYYLLRFILWYFVGGIFAWIVDGLIRKGNLSNYLLKPGNFLIYPIFWEQGWKLASLVLSVPTLAIFSIALGVSPLYGVTLGSFLIALIAIVLGAIMFIELQILISLSTFWLGSARGADAINSLLSGVFGGAIVPIVLLPAWFQDLCSTLPFRYLFAFPVEIAQSQYGVDLIIRGFAIQLIWITVLSVLCRITYHKGLIKNEGFGN